MRHNVALLRALIPPGTRLCAAVKANAYGHGARTVIPLLSEHVDCFGVATPAEATELLEMGCRTPILVFFSVGACQGSAELHGVVEDLVARDVWLTVTCLADAELVAAAAARVGRPAGVHVKVDSGMGRSGLSPEALPAVVESIRAKPGLRLVGIYTHFAVAEEADKTYTLWQLRRFLGGIRASNVQGALLHSANSAATIDLPQSHLGMVRPGLAVYGYQPSDQMHVRLPLRPVLRLTARLAHVTCVRAGCGCGHALAYTFARDGRGGLVPVGYGDGYPRSLSNKACMRVAGKDAPVRGQVSMDQTIIDLTDIPSAKVGDEVEVISSDPLAPNSVESLARLAGTIPYEITSRMGPRVDRVPVEEWSGGSTPGGRRNDVDA